VIPHYLAKKLHALNINDLNSLKRHNPIQVFQWLRFNHKSTSYQTLYDLHSLITLSKLSLITNEAKVNLQQLYKNSLPSYPPLAQDTINYYLHEAHNEAIAANECYEVPIGAIITQDDTEAPYNESIIYNIIGRGHNKTLATNNICAHAEIMAIQDACNTINNHRLNNCDLYVTIEPCLMCVGAILNSRIRRVVFGAIEPKTGALISQYKVLENKAVNHQTEAIGPIDNEFYQKPIQLFMQGKRK
jgi:tRNA(adenine34) deaminase